MEINKFLDSEKIDYIKSMRWYHQRFDACPHLLLPIAYGEVCREERKPEGTAAEYRCTILFEGKSDWYMLEEDNEKTTNLFVEKADAGNINFSESLMGKWKEDEERIYGIFSEIDEIELDKLSNEDLLELHRKTMDAYISRFTSSSIIDGFALGSDRVLAKKIHEHLKKIGRDEEYDRLFSTLTAPVHLSFTNEAELSLLHIANEIRKKPELHGLFIEKKVHEILMKISEYPDIDRMLAQHQKGYFWTKNNYNDAFVLTEEQFISEIRRLFAEGIDIEHELDYIKGHPEKNKKTKGTLMKELSLPIDIKALIRYSEDFTHWQDERKKATFIGAHYILKILEEIGKRYSHDLDEMKQLLPDEVEKLAKGVIGKEELKKRKRGCFVFFNEKEAFITTEEKIIAELREYFDSMDLPDEKIDVIKGLCASLGKAKGKVKVIKSAREISKVEKGDILVAVMTRPDYVIGMKKAAAIVTNEGGITCHAAIVARELRIPCVIATKFATKILKDGDIVEVNADKGEVRIITDKRKD
jgi:phosphohistidine swiveling domain-containing protein